MVCFRSRRLACRLWSGLAERQPIGREGCHTVVSTAHYFCVTYDAGELWAGSGRLRRTERRRQRAGMPQMVEHRTENPNVPSSNLGPSTSTKGDGREAVAFARQGKRPVALL